MSEKIRILCVDDHAFLAEGLRARLSLEEDFDCVGWVGSAAHLYDEVTRTNAQVLLLDIEMPGPDPFEALRDLQRRLPEVRVIMLSAYVRDHYVDAAVKAGAWGYVSKSDAPSSVVEAIRKVVAGEFAFGPKVLEKTSSEAAPEIDSSERRHSKLTPREMEVLRLIGKGHSRGEIASLLHRSPKTVDNHRAAIMEKLGIHDRVELARYAIREGISDAE